jgi:phage tail-like protein
MSMRGTVDILPTPHPMGPSMPALYQEDPFAQAFLEALDTVLAPVVGTLDNLDAYLDPYLAPDDFLGWLATWVGMTIDESWTSERRRQVVARAVELYRLRGTATGLAEQIAIHTGGTVEIIENGGTAWSIDAGGELPGSAKPLLVVRIQVDDPKSIDGGRIEALVAASKPAHVEHRVEIVRLGKKGAAKADAGSDGATDAPDDAEKPSA